MKSEPGSMAFFEEFASHIAFSGENECWEFSPTFAGVPYGRISFAGRNRGAHRMMYRMHWGEIPPGMFICHSCDNPRCVNPLHLFAGRPTDNTQDMVRKGRNRNGHVGQTHCKRGHEFNERNTRIYDGRRHCRLCDHWNKKHKSKPREQ